eukprot:TRINITY_DN27126_c0_g1_i1.p1 TRINITY_DN27126_c0_g1~~TRINITY_DN27126_c0_g1_i1.p1  ORF type:complete len:430 (+),score=139.91 TRINITY_DN27126_c0_g1_i1:77-1366(+)
MYIDASDDYHFEDEGFANDLDDGSEDLEDRALTEDEAGEDDEGSLATGATPFPGRGTAEPDTAQGYTTGDLHTGTGGFEDEETVPRLHEISKGTIDDEIGDLVQEDANVLEDSDALASRQRSRLQNLEELLQAAERRDAAQNQGKPETASILEPFEQQEPREGKAATASVPEPSGQQEQPEAKRRRVDEAAASPAAAQKSEGDVDAEVHQDTSATTCVSADGVVGCAAISTAALLESREFPGRGIPEPEAMSAAMAWYKTMQADTAVDGGVEVIDATAEDVAEVGSAEDVEATGVAAAAAAAEAAKAEAAAQAAVAMAAAMAGESFEDEEPVEMDIENNANNKETAEEVEVEIVDLAADRETEVADSVTVEVGSAKDTTEEVQSVYLSLLDLAAQQKTALDATLDEIKRIESLLGIAAEVSVDRMISAV